MFALNKNTVSPPLKQSPTDSPVFDPPSTASSTSDLWMSPRPDGSSHGDLTSPEPRAREQHTGRRTSVFTLRSRSNTGASTTSSFGSQSPPGMTGQSGDRSSQDLRHISSQSFLDISNSRRSLFRGKKGKRQSGAYSPGLMSDEFQETDVRGKRSSVLRKSKRAGNQTEGLVHNLKHRISSPFDFQHLTHTDRHQFASMEQASENELVAEYWAVRASQAPRRDLTGIKAEDLHFQNFSTENVIMPDLRASSAQDFRSAVHSPEPPQGEFASQESASRPPLRLSRSVESFSQPGVNRRPHRHTQSVNAPPRMSSLAPIHDVPEDNADSKRTLPRGRSSQSNRNSGMWDTSLPRSPLSSEKLPTMAEEPAFVGHALTTPDDSAIHPPTPPFSPDLEDVAEEPERFVSPRPAPQPPLKSPRSPKSPFFESFSFSSPRSPIAKSNRRGSFTSPKSLNQRNSMTRPMSQMSETLGSPSMTRRVSIRRAPTVRRKSNTWRVMEESWEDDIDYIYDNALEAECDLDWDRTSDDGSCERDRTPEQSDYRRASNAASQSTQTSMSASENEPTSQSFYEGTFGPSLQVSASSLPELESTSAISASTSDTGVRTPFEFFSSLEHRPTSFEEAEGFSLTPSLLVPQEYKEELAREDMYEDLLASYDGSDRHFPFLDAAQSIDGSSRASHIRSSKRSSYDSSLMSLSGHGSGSWSSPVRRSASSSGSLPELVHSRRARHDFSMVVDDLSEQVASIASLGEEDPEDITPPGCVSPERTFFTSADEPQAPSKTIQASIESEVRASLELARQGSHRSSRAPASHKYASSDGAAKMLAAPLADEPVVKDAPTTRARAATTSQTRGHRPPQLSLFPAPPKRQPYSPATSATYNHF